MRERFKKFRLRTFVLFLLYCLIVLEVCLRIFYHLCLTAYSKHYFPENASLSLKRAYICRVFAITEDNYKFDPVCYVLPEKERFFRSRTSNRMFVSYPKKKRKKEIRILCLGDSTTIGNGVKFTDTYPAQLELLMEKKYWNPNIVVLNAGIPAKSRIQKRIFQFHLVDYAPDIVIWRSGADLSDIYKVNASFSFLKKATWRCLYSMMTFRLSCLLLDEFLKRSSFLNKDKYPFIGTEFSVADIIYSFIVSGFLKSDQRAEDNCYSDFELVKKIARDHNIEYVFAVDYLREDLKGNKFVSDYSDYERKHIKPVVKTVDVMNEQLKKYKFSQLSLDSACHLTREGYSIVAQIIGDYIIGQGWIEEIVKKQQEK